MPRSPAAKQRKQVKALLAEVDTLGRELVRAKDAGAPDAEAGVAACVGCKQRLLRLQQTYWPDDQADQGTPA